MPPTKAKRKVKYNGLRFSIPTDTARREDFVKNQLLTPNRLEEKEDIVPLDFTSISSREVGRQHSVWAVRHSHLIFLVGNLRAEVGNAKYDLKNIEAEWMLKHVGDFKTKWEAEYAMVRSKKIRRMRKQLSRAEASLIRYEALAESYEGLRNAASREIARRSDERASRD